MNIILNQKQFEWSKKQKKRLTQTKKTTNKSIWDKIPRKYLAGRAGNHDTRFMYALKPVIGYDSLKEDLNLIFC